MPAYISKETGTGRKGYLEWKAQEYEKEQAAKKAAFEALGLTFKVFDVECPVLYGGAKAICIGVNENGFDAFRSIEEAEMSSMSFSCFPTDGLSSYYVEEDIIRWARTLNIGGVWE